ncbi:cytochrome P450 [Rhizobacter sp. P5_C2]
MASNAGRDIERTTLYQKDLRRILENSGGNAVFRIGPGTVGIQDGALARAVLEARELHDFERTIFKPVRGQAMSAGNTAAILRAAAQDVRRAIDELPNDARTYAGDWPARGYEILHRAMFGRDGWMLRGLSSRVLDASVWAQRLALGAAERWPAPFAQGESALAQQVLRGMPRGAERSVALVLYRRIASALCETVSKAVANTFWLSSKAQRESRPRQTVAESLRLLPPAWMLLRSADPAFARLDEGIGERDDLLVFPLLIHRNATWDSPEEFAPARWDALGEPDTLANYLPFGHGRDRCHARSLVLSMTQALLARVVTQDLDVSPRQKSAGVRFAPLLAVAHVKLTHA